MKTEEMIKELKEKGYEIKKPKNRFLEVKFSDRDNVLMDDDGEILVQTWDDEKDLNDFGYLEKEDVGQFKINGNIHKFEFLYNDKWLICDNRMDVRFLRWIH